MRRTDSLFQLVKAMNRTDKRNFKLLTQLTSGDKKYLRLFDAIDRQSVYDEDRLVKLFRGDPMVKQFSVSKNYLYNSILRSLVHFYQGKSQDLSTTNLQVLILSDKNLHTQAMKLLRKAKSRAAEVEDFNELQQLLTSERMIVEELMDYRTYEQELEQLRLEEILTEEKTINLRRYRHLLDAVNRITLGHRNAREKEDREQIAAIVSDPLLQYERAALCSRARILFFTIWAEAYSFLNDAQAARGMNQSCLAVWESSRKLREAMVGEHIAALRRLATDHLALRRPEAVRETLKRLRALRTFNEREELLRQESLLLIRLLLALFSGDVGEGRLVLDDLKKLLAEHKDHLSRDILLQLYYYAAMMNLVDGKPAESHRWINAFQDEPRTELRQDLQCFVRLANLVIQLERENLDLLEHRLKSATRYIFNRNRMYQVERLVLRTIRMLIQMEDPEDQGRILRAMQAEMESLGANRFEAPALQVLLLPAWVSSKLGGNGMPAILREWFAGPPGGTGTHRSGLGPAEI